MIYYSKLTTKNTFNKAKKIFELNNIKLDKVIFDKSSNNNLLKEKLIKDKNLTIDLINSLGKNNREISNSLQWLTENNIKIVVLEFTQTKKIDACMLLNEIYLKLANIEIENLKKAQRIGIDKALNNKIKYGRPKTEYPKNWNELYKKWKNKEIRAVDFIKMSNLKKATFYKMLKNYENDL